ncbi:uncharacterized protein EAE97_009973 [Botrytis byssoidea]|uniref:Uncharacterized protein n=1 Tax=Botrytis byssoidea TaxID=139641 RepID=A0A9P5HYR7_9HELO|nr:uncharacterized protein EAE97_009973 [Botrytis byssoidea]KAF7927298.1 hypothetical protein EAE97_009973 [Botrytis byssoidea]
MATEDTEMGGTSVVPLHEDTYRSFDFPPLLPSPSSYISEVAIDANKNPPLDKTSSASVSFESTELLADPLIWRKTKKETNGVKPHPNSIMLLLTLTTIPQHTGVSATNHSNLAGLSTAPLQSDSLAPTVGVQSRKSITENQYQNENVTSEYDKLSAIIDRHHAGFPTVRPSPSLPLPITSGGSSKNLISSKDEYLGPLTISGRPGLFATLRKKYAKVTGSSSLPPTEQIGLNFDADITTYKPLELSKAWRVMRVYELLLRAVANTEPGNVEGRVEILNFYLQEYPLQRLVILKALENVGHYFPKFSKAMSVHSSKPHREQWKLSDDFKKENPIPPIIRPLLPFASIAASYIRNTKSTRRGGTSSLHTYKDHHYHNGLRCKIEHENESFPLGFNPTLMHTLGKCCRQRLRNERHERHKVYKKQAKKGLSHVHRNPILSEEIIKECGGETYAELVGRVDMDDMRNAAYWEMTTRQIEEMPTRKDRYSVFKKRPSPLRKELPKLDNHWIPDSVMPYMKISGQIIKFESEIVRANKRKQDTDNEAEGEEREMYESRCKVRKLDSEKVEARMAQWEREYNTAKKQILKEHEEEMKKEEEEMRRLKEEKKAEEERERLWEAQEKRIIEKEIQRKEKNERLRMERERAKDRAKDGRERRKEKRDRLRWENRERSDCRVTQAWIDLGADMARVGSWD